MSHRKPLRAWRWTALAVLAIGLALVAYMIVGEGEPGALPLALVLLGGGGYAVAALRSRVKARRAPGPRDLR